MSIFVTKGRIAGRARRYPPTFVSLCRPFAASRNVRRRNAASGKRRAPPRKLRAVEVTHYAVAGALTPITTEEGDRGWSVDTESLEQRPIGSVRRDVGAKSGRRHAHLVRGTRSVRRMAAGDGGWNRTEAKADLHSST